MDITARRVTLETILPWRDLYRAEMNCQIIHDSIHSRPGWTEEYCLTAGRESAGYGSVAVGGPWTNTPTVYEFYVLPPYRVRVFDLFETLLSVTRAPTIIGQSNAPLLTAMIHAYGRRVRSEAVIFHDSVTTSLSPDAVLFRTPTAAEEPELAPERLKWHGVVEVNGAVAATGGILFHYNRPYGDIYMDVNESFRRRGIGSFLVQELKRVCYEGGHVPAARCSTANVASRRTLQKAGFAPCGHLLRATVGERSNAR
jgi:GNAT superfamily N-acetyltransferase